MNKFKYGDRANTIYVCPRCSHNSYSRKKDPEDGLYFVCHNCCNLFTNLAFLVNTHDRNYCIVCDGLIEHEGDLLCAFCQSNSDDNLDEDG